MQPSWPGAFSESVYSSCVGFVLVEVCHEAAPHPLAIKTFAHISKAAITFKDLTILAGPQASGKSLILQLWKLILDRREIIPALREAGDDVSTSAALLDAVLGQGMHLAWNDRTEVIADGRVVSLDKMHKWIRGREDPSVFFVPAHRGLLLADGWAQPFGKMTANVPVVARLFSQALNERFVRAGAGQLSPQGGDLKREYRDALDAALFHGGTVRLQRRDGQSAFRLSLKYGAADLPYMTWTAGQREATPLLLGLMQVLPSRARVRVPGLEWIVIEEPEMGLHPQAINAVMMLVLECLYRGYKVVMSTHSPLVLDLAWAIARFKKLGSNEHFLLDALGIEQTQSMKKVAAAVLEKDVCVHALNIDQRDFTVRSFDISDLDPFSENDIESGWAGLTSFSSNIGNAVAAAVNASGDK